jgi:hypothetical protein
MTHLTDLATEVEGGLLGPTQSSPASWGGAQRAPSALQLGVWLL